LKGRFFELALTRKLREPIGSTFENAQSVLNREPFKDDSRIKAREGPRELTLPNIVCIVADIDLGARECPKDILARKEQVEIEQTTMSALVRVTPT
jgi:hypothetical protein